MSSKYNGLSPEEFAKVLSVGECTVYRWIRDDLIPYSDRRIPKNFITRVKRLWDKTCTASDAARMLGVSTSKINDMLRRRLFS